MLSSKYYFTHSVLHGQFYHILIFQCGQISSYNLNNSHCIVIFILVIVFIPIFVFIKVIMIRRFLLDVIILFIFSQTIILGKIFKYLICLPQLSLLLSTAYFATSIASLYSPMIFKSSAIFIIIPSVGLTLFPNFTLQ